MESYPVFTLNAVEKKDLPSATKVINQDEFEYYLWIKVPVEFRRHFELYQIDKMSEPKEELDINAFCKHDKGNMWYQIKSFGLCNKPGHHVYKMSFVHKENGITSSLFFGYIVQADDPEKPYRYMDRSGECSCNETN